MTHSSSLRVILSHSALSSWPKCKVERMKGLLKLLSIFVLVGFFATDALAAKPKILLLKDLQPGTKAIGFSVFKGVEPQPFDVVLGNTIDYRGNSLILSRVSGGPMETLLEEIGAVAGMSGSPVFIGDCKDLEECVTKASLDGNDVFLVGSTSYGPGSFIKGGPNFLLTPAEYMLGAKASGYVAATHFYSSLPNEIIVNGNKFTNLLLFPKMENLFSEWAPSPAKRGDKGTLSTAGNSSGRCNESVKSDIKPGSMVSVYLATGSVNVGGSGTVTWRDENNIYVFGHPFMGTGMVQYPFVQVSVADTLQTPVGASKLVGCSLDIKGVMLVDGAFEMSGVIGGAAPMLPYQVELHIGNNVVTLHEEIASSSMAGGVIKQLPEIWASQLFGDLSHFSVAYQLRIAIADQPEIFVKNFIPVQINKNPFNGVFAKVYDPFQKLNASGFSYGVESIKAHLDVIKGFELWTVKNSFLSQANANPGETVYANIILEEYFSLATKQISIPIKVPEDLIERADHAGVPHQITLLVQSGNKFTDKRPPEETTSLSDLIGQLNKSMNYKTNVLYVQEIMPKSPRSKADQEADNANAKASTKPAWKWADIGEGDLKQFPTNNKNDVILTLSPSLNDFIDLDLTFDLQIESKKSETSEVKKETKHRKWYMLFLS